MTNKPKCKFCWDKGYASVLDGGKTIAPDFIGDKRLNEGMKEYKKYCLKCAKGRKMAKSINPVEDKDWEDFDKKFCGYSCSGNIYFNDMEHSEDVIKMKKWISQNFISKKKLEGWINNNK